MWLATKAAIESRLSKELNQALGVNSGHKGYSLGTKIGWVV